MSNREVLVIGAGPAGLSAAIAAARSGALVTLVDEGVAAGGQLLYRGRLISPGTSGSAMPGRELAAALVAEADAAGVTVMTRTTVWGAFGDGSFGATRGDQPLVFHPAAAVLATGSTDLPVVFPGGSLPGVFTGRAALKLANEWGTLPGQRWALIGRSRVSEVEDGIVAAGGSVAAHASVTARLHGVGGALLEAIEMDGERYPVECVALCAGRQPEAMLAMMRDVSFGYSFGLGGFVPVTDAASRTSQTNLLVCGDAAGSCSPEIALAEGAVAGVAAAVAAGVAGADALIPEQERHADRLAPRLAERRAIRPTFVQPAR